MGIARRLWSSYKIQSLILIAFLTLWLVFFILNPSAYMNPLTYTALLSVAPIVILSALSLTYIVILGEIDLSFPSVIAVSALIVAITWSSSGPNLGGLLLAIAAGAAIGSINGFIVAKMRVPSFIATLGTMFFWRGVVLVVTQGYGISLYAYRDTAWFGFFVGRIGFIPAQFIWAVVVATALWILLNRHIFGAYVYYVGNNRVAARAMGINVDRVIVLAYSLHGMVAALAGIIALLENSVFWPSIGDIYLLRSIAAVVVGGTPLTGGVGTILGTFTGGLLLEWIVTGLLASGVSGYWTDLFYGLVILMALILQRVLRGRRED